MVVRGGMGAVFWGSGSGLMVAVHFDGISGGGRRSGLGGGEGTVKIGGWVLGFLARWVFGGWSGWVVLLGQDLVDRAFEE